MRERTDACRPDRAMPAGSGSGGDTDSAELERGYRKAEAVQAEGIFGQDLHRHADSGRAGDEVFGVQLVESGEVAHVRQEAGGLDHLFKAHPCGGENGSLVFAAEHRLGGDPQGSAPVTGSSPNQPEVNTKPLAS